MLASRVLRHFQPATRVFWVLTAGLFFCCGTDEAINLHPTTPIEGDAGDGGSVSGTGATGFAGGNNPLAGSANQGGNGNDSGAPGGGTAPAGAPTAMAGAGGADQGPVSEQLGFCERLTMRSLHASDIARLFDHAVFDDCNIKWVTDLYLVPQGVHDDFLNDLVQWNLQFWGCPGLEPVQNFALIYGEAPLSAGDVSLLIEHYVNIATTELDMSQPEISAMRDALERLSQKLINDPSPSPSQSRCETGGGGAGGAAGEAAVGGVGGTAPSETAGQGGVD